ncbi:hypothetical protein LX32DRAFT_202070 [Colletotrichum zoysiae]|uniref:Uncharacterized protein n=1 Tax=Colletotrichum zoysiae TaxID=1216348 RepID=A0AAD9LXV9_9PEZI|nr:hypothetical protein LX32DRAFT_202070 [Colletotrichum zoysiae]
MSPLEFCNLEGMPTLFQTCPAVRRLVCRWWTTGFAATTAWLGTKRQRTTQSGGNLSTGAPYLGAHLGWGCKRRLPSGGPRFLRRVCRGEQLFQIVTRRPRTTRPGRLTASKPGWEMHALCLPCSSAAWSTKEGLTSLAMLVSCSGLRPGFLPRFFLVFLWAGCLGVTRILPSAWLSNRTYRLERSDGGSPLGRWPTDS